jgi:hypothetical protein
MYHCYDKCGNKIELGKFLGIARYRANKIGAKFVFSNDGFLYVEIATGIIFALVVLP